MIDGAHRVPRGTTLAADLCIVGGGPAGITLALSLSGKGLSVLLLEAGERPKDAKAQALYAGELAPGRPHAPPHLHRLRGLGGTSAGWDGRCVPLDAIDFEVRPHVPHSGWPISHEGLLPYYARAHAWVEAGRFDYDARNVLPPAPAPLSRLEGDVLRSHLLERYSGPTDFGRRYQRRLELASDVRVLCGAHCTAVRLEPGGRNVRALDVATLGGNRFHVSARVVVLATGALETARLLLNSDDVVPQGVGNQLDVVGRYYQSHLAGQVGTLALRGMPAHVPADDELAPDGTACRRRFALDPAQQRRHGLLNAAARVQRREQPTARPAWVRQALGLAREPIDAASRLAARLRQQTPASPPPRAGLGLHVQAEQQPLASSRVQLSEQTDALGMRRLKLDWRYCLADILSVARTLDLVAQELGRTGAGRFTYERDQLEEDLLAHGPAPGHHIGTARMGRDVRTSVVDPDCRLHLVGNLYVAGSAVFPTCGQADPTLTVLALTLRLADRLTRRLQPRRAATEELFA
ncbi:MAG TPA: GMC family oxidoreductase [Ramlibacter sp.]|jgi:choline dehydrogenase-like flavoprotein|uniref:GMC family oxidoreductase n=1 Tax=Ramlibacter sp. TaxID=1917967 RepID=UPI002D46D096|nr:GMC family oxidoreductase [Ramlibacter sp.]HZY20173.1 GMC family oxidoreductase [Ramlibacter sp.]